MAEKKKPKATAIVTGGRKKIHYEYPDGHEMVEEYDIVSDELCVRKTRKHTTLGGEGPWVFEIGEDTRKHASVVDDISISESSNQPNVVRRDHIEYFIWRIRNLSYPKSVYSVKVEEDTPTKITVRTSNKKYFKRLEFPELGTSPLDQKSVSWDHNGSVLEIRYRKPDEVVRNEMIHRRERQNIKVEHPPKDGDLECNPS